MSKVLVQIDNISPYVNQLQDLIQAQKPKHQFRDSYNNRKEFPLPCWLCKMEKGNDSGKSRDYKSIAELRHHISHAHKPTDIDGKKHLVYYLQLLQGLSIIIDQLNGSHEILIDVVKTLVKIEAIH